MPANRLSALDASFLAAETPTAHMHVGWAAVFDPPEDGPRPSFKQLRDHIAARLDRAPRYRQRLAFVPLDLHDPEWVDDDRFDIDEHVLEEPVSSIDDLVAVALSTPLERSRPLWEVWISPQLEDGRIGLVGKVHHSMVDGLAAVELGSLLLDPDPAPPAPPCPKWKPEPAPSPLERLARGVADRAAQQLGLAALPARIIAKPGRLSDASGEVRRAGLALVSSFRQLARPTYALNEQSSPLRHVGRLSRPIEDLRTIKSHFGTTVNDVVLAVSAGAMRRFLEERGEQPFALKAMVPASLRGSEEAGDLGNRISFMFMELPADEPDPVLRLEQINAATSERKRNGEPEGGDTVLRLLSHTPRFLQRVATRLISDPHTFNLVVSNIPGPPGPLWMRGCALREVYPVVPLADRHALAIGVTSMQDRLFFGLYADRKTLPDVEVVSACIDAEIDLLLDAAKQARSRRGSRARSRDHARRDGRAPATTSGRR